LQSYAKLFEKARRYRITHHQMHVFHSSRSAVYLRLGAHDRAAEDASLALAHIHSLPLRKADGAAAHASYIRALRVRSDARLQLDYPYEARRDVETALKEEPQSLMLKDLLQRCEEAVQERSALSIDRAPSPLPAPARKPIRFLPPHDGALRCVREQSHSIIPQQLLSKQQAEQDVDIRDIFGVLKSFCDFRLPQRVPKLLHQRHAQIQKLSAAMQEAIVKIKVLLPSYALCLHRWSY